jgi:hypothetical protein
MTLTVVSNPTSGGEIDCQPSSSDGRYYPSDNVTLTAVAASGHKFVNWTGDVGEVEDTMQSTVIVPMDKYYSKGITRIEITANFVLAGWSGLPTWSWAIIGIAAVLAVATVAYLIRRRFARQWRGVSTDL